MATRHLYLLFYEMHVLCPIGFFLIYLYELFVYPEYQSFVNIYVVNVLSHFVACLFLLFNGIF